MVDTGKITGLRYRRFLISLNKNRICVHKITLEKRTKKLELSLDLISMSGTIYGYIS
jgi:hypothetical protein